MEMAGQWSFLYITVVWLAYVFNLILAQFHYSKEFTKDIAMAPYEALVLRGDSNSVHGVGVRTAAWSVLCVAMAYTVRRLLIL